jgi:hypothetical protein
MTAPPGIAELTTTDVEAYTHGRLTADDPETARLLALALKACRTYCGWHVTPVLTDDEVTLDGPGAPLLILPTMRLVELTAMTEQGVDVDLSFVYASARGSVRKMVGYPVNTSTSNDWWNWVEYASPTVYPYFNYDLELYWAGGYSTITATMTHGYDDAVDWQSAVLSYLNRASMNPTGGEEIIGPFRLMPQTITAGGMFTAYEKPILDLYKLPRPA